MELLSHKRSLVGSSRRPFYSPRYSLQLSCPGSLSLGARLLCPRWCGLHDGVSHAPAVQGGEPSARPASWLCSFSLSPCLMNGERKLDRFDGSKVFLPVLPPSPLLPSMLSSFPNPSFSVSPWNAPGKSCESVLKSLLHFQWLPTLPMPQPR